MIRKKTEKDTQIVLFMINNKERKATLSELALSITPVNVEAIIYLDQKKQRNLFYIDPLGR